jgi:protein-S-isoprenylcysteine O-methyltransferase Ste14
LLFALGFAAGWMIERARPLALVPGAPRWTEPAGLAIVALGLGLMAWALLTFRRARTAVYPNRPAARLVAAGPYRWSRNPMYVGLTAAYLGLALLADTAWPVLLLPVVLVALTLGVIRREERYLAAAFGPAYADYRRRVRRWL